MTSDLDDLVWADGVEAATLTLLGGMRAKSRIGAAIGTPNGEFELDFGEAYAEAWGGSGVYGVPLQFHECAAGTIVIEPNGYLLSIVVRASEITAGGGSLLSVYWCDAIGNASVLAARDGQVVRSF